MKIILLNRNRGWVSAMNS